MELVSMINYALPGTIVGIAYLIAFNDPPIELTARRSSSSPATSSATGPPASARPSRCCSRSTRASRKRRRAWAPAATTFRRVTLPLILPAFFAGLGVVFIRSMTAISATIFLVSISWTLITVKILENITELSLGPRRRFRCSWSSIVFVVIAVIGRVLRLFRAPGAMP
jgi:iron(III) transport system permease protein